MFNFYAGKHFNPVKEQWCMLIGKQKGIANDRMPEMSI